MSAASDRLSEFIEAFDVGDDHPWSSLIGEEACEAEVAVDEAQGARDNAVFKMAAARELADVRVTVEGAAVALGIDLDAAFNAVMDANMAKLPDCETCRGGGRIAWEGLLIGDCARCNGTGKGKPIKREDGKVLKPEGWQPPDMSKAVRA